MREMHVLVYTSPIRISFQYQNRLNAIKQYNQTEAEIYVSCDSFLMRKYVSRNGAADRIR